MNLDNLISKYLDGELTLEEDMQLRKLIAEDPLAKETFDEFVEMNYMVKEDAGKTKTPLDLKNSTEDKILMRILSNSGDNGIMYPETNKKKKNRVVLVPIFILLIGFFSFLNFDLFTLDKPKVESKINLIMELPDIKNYDSQISELSNEINKKNKVDEISSKTDFKKTTDISNTKRLIANISSSKSSMQINETSTNNTQLDDIETKITIVNNKLEEKPRNNNNPIVSITNNDIFTSDLSLANNNSKLLGLESSNVNIFSSNRLIVSSNAGNEIFRNGFDPKSAELINNFNQSISLKLDDDKRVGVEIGFQDYQFDQLNRVVLDYDGGYSPDIEGQMIGLNKISTLVESTQNYRRTWAMVYFDNRLINYRKLDLFSRVGLGASQDGPMLAGNFYVEYEIFSGLGLTAGFDIRLFDADYSNFIGQTSGYKFNTNFVYGLNFSF